MPAAWAEGEQVLERVTVVVGAANVVGVADSANVDTTTRKQLEAHTVYWPGELLEATPGLIVSQHSGERKANQFHLRGFNLDRGTDLRTTVDGMLINQRSHPPRMRVQIEGFNLANRRASAIDYYGTSCLPGEAAAGVNDVHFHPIESRSFRVSLVTDFWGRQPEWLRPAIPR